MFMIKNKKLKEEKESLLHIPNISEKIVVKTKEEYFNYIYNLKQEKNINTFHFINKENSRFFMSNPNRSNINILNGYEYLYLKSETSFQEIIFKYLKIKEINNPVLESFITFFTEHMYKIIEVKYFNYEEISIREIINIHLNYIKEIEEYNTFMKEQIKDSVKYHISGLFYELGFKEILEDIKREIINIDHGLINLQGILDLRSIDVYETSNKYNSILSNVFFKENTKSFFSTQNNNLKMSNIRKIIIFDEIPNDIFRSVPVAISQLRAMGIYVIFPYMEGEEIEMYLNANVKTHILNNSEE